MKVFLTIVPLRLISFHLFNLLKLLSLIEEVELS